MSGCSGNQSDVALLEPASGNIAGNKRAELHLSLSQALEIAMENNLDARVAALQVLATENQVSLAHLEAFPEMSFSGGFRGRSSLPASSSQSVISGNQSLEPSVSTEQYRRFYDLSIQWNTIDLALAVLQSKNAGLQTSIRQTRYERIAGNIRRDVFGAYMRGLLAQKNNPTSPEILKSAFSNLRNIQTAQQKKLISYEGRISNQAQRISRQIKALKSQKQDNEAAILELKSLLNLPASTRLYLTGDIESHIASTHKWLELDVAKLEQKALAQRPELQEADLNIELAERSKREEIWRTVPGAEVTVDFRKDSNDFLVDNRWVSFSASIVQNLLNLISLPARYRAADNEIALEMARKEALTTAVVFQVHLARKRLQFAQEMLLLARDMKKISAGRKRELQARSQAGLASVSKAVLGTLDQRVAEMAYERAIIDVYEAYAQLMASIGESELPESEADHA